MSNWTVKLDSHEDGLNDNWSYEDALMHVRRCEYDERGVKYELVEHKETDDSLQPTDESPKRPRSRKSSS